MVPSCSRCSRCPAFGPLPPGVRKLPAVHRWRLVRRPRIYEIRLLVLRWPWPGRPWWRTPARRGSSLPGSDFGRTSRTWADTAPCPPGPGPWLRLRRQRHQSGSSRTARSVSPSAPPERAIQLLRAAGFHPAEAYRGFFLPWTARCPACDGVQRIRLFRCRSGAKTVLGLPEQELRHQPRGSARLTGLSRNRRSPAIRRSRRRKAAAAPGVRRSGARPPPCGRGPRPGPRRQPGARRRR